jgi:acetolactate synthase-1/2/3 large subunit
MSRISGADALVESLLAQGVDTIFGLPGGQLDHLFDAIYRSEGQLKLVRSRHEQGCAYMAYGYAKSTGRVGVYTVVPGPGLLNSTCALCTAYAANAQVLCVSGQIPLGDIGSGLGHLHEIPDQLALVRGLTKWAERIEHPAHTPLLMNEAFRQLKTGRPRPVELEMPMDVMAQKSEVAAPVPLRPPVHPPIDSEQVEQAVQLLAGAKNPLIIVGGGAIEAGPILLKLAEKLQAPVVSKRHGRGVISDRHYLSQVLPAGHRLWRDADVVLAVGSRIKMPLTMWGHDDNLRIVRIDIDPVQITKPIESDVAMVNDASEALQALFDAMNGRFDDRPSREQELTALKQEFRDKFAECIGPQFAYLQAIREALPDDGFFVDEVTQVGFSSWYAFPVYEPRHFISAGYQGTLGYGFATALGVQVGNPDKAVVSINGDGGFMFNLPEIATAVQYNIPLVTIVFNDNTYGNVKRQQKEWFDGHYIASDLHNPDYLKLADAVGMRGYRAESPDALRTVLLQAFEERQPCLIEVPVGEMPTPWQFILMEQVREQLAG